MGGGDRELVKEFDKDGNGRLDKEERKAARESIQKERAQGGGGGRGGRGFGPPGGPGGGPPGMEGERVEAKPGVKIAPGEVKPVDGGFYEPGVLRTLFLDFDGADWEKEMSDFYRTDVEVPATLTVDGKKYPNVGVGFRGATSFMFVPEGSKRSLNISVDFADEKQRLMGYRSLNLLNANTDPSFLRTVLYFQIARQWIAAPKANLVRVVINGENWGIYVNAQQFNKEMLSECFKSSKGTRWKVPGSPRGSGGLEYFGEDVAEYKRRYSIKSKDSDESWTALIRLCRTLKETPTEKLEEALAPMLDVDGALRFLAIDNALINNDGYWVRASDYSIYLDEKGVFHILPHDANETLQPASMGPGGGGRGRRGPGEGGRGPDSRPGDGPGAPGGGTAASAPRGVGIELDPLIGLTDTNKPLRSRLLAVPALKRRYLEYVKAIARDALDWSKLGPMAESYRKLIEKEVELDTKKLVAFAAFQQSISGSSEGDGARRGMPSLKEFAERRRAYLLAHPEIQALEK